MKITLAVVAYNEEKYLPRLLEDVKAQDYPHDEIEVLFVDSASTDGTRDVMEEFLSAGEEFYNVAIKENPKKRLSAGCNVAIESFTTDALVRVDAHARIPSDFISACVSALSDDEYVVGGARPTICEEEGGFSKVLWMAEESMFGSSVSSARRKTSDGEKKDAPREKKYVNSVFHVCYRREVTEKCGGFREDLGRTEDNEFYYRIRKNGYRIYNSPDIYSEQYIRPSFGKMIKQKTGNGYWIGRTLGFVPGCISIYHLVPLAFILAIATTAVMAICGWLMPLQLLGSLYLSVAVLMAIFAAFKLQYEGERVPASAILLPVIFFCLHVCYGAGTFLGILSIPFGRKR